MGQRPKGKAPRLNDLLSPKARAKARDTKSGTSWPVAAGDGTAEMKRLQPHPAAELFPMLSDAELDELAADIKAKGQLEPITVTIEGLILDGRNRYEACRRAGVAVKCEEWHVAGSPTAWVLSKNLHRRHLTTDQRAVIALEAEAMFATEAKERQRAAGGDRKSEAAKTDRLPPRGGKRSERTPTAAQEAAKATGASARQVERAKRLRAQRPELLAKVKTEGLTLKQAEKQLVKEQRTKEVLEYKPPKGKYAVIVADPPWRYDDELDGSDGARAGLPYPSMSVDEICAMKVGENLATPDCALWLWVTTAFLIDGTAATVLRAWGFEPKTMLTWVKDRWGAGRYLRNQTEHCILAVRGKPLVLGQNQSTVLNAPRRGHSEKPAEAFEVFKAVTPAAPDARLELFARAERPHWVTSGSEVKPPSKKAGLHETPMEWDRAEPEPTGATPAQPAEPEGFAAELARKGPNGQAVMRYPLQWQRPRGGDEHPLAVGPSGCLYRITKHRQGLVLNTVTQTLPDGKPGSAADLVSISQCEARAEEWEQVQLERKAAEQRASPKKRKLPPIVDVPPATPPRVQQRAFELIVWRPKKHSVQVAVGSAARTGRRYAIDRQGKAVMTAGGKTKKIDGYTFRWFCTTDGASSLEDFESIEQAQAAASSAEESFQRSKGAA